MDCTKFLAGHSEYLDGVLAAEEAEGFSRHMEVCSSCARYHRVLVKGRELLRTLPPVEPSFDFYPRLQHRLYHVMDEAPLEYGSRASGASTAAAVAIAVLMAVAAWSPLARREPPQVELPPIVVDEPPRHRFGYSFPWSFTPDLLTPLAATGSSGIWNRPNMLLYLYSPLGAQERQARSVRTTFRFE